MCEPSTVTSGVSLPVGARYRSCHAACARIVARSSPVTETLRLLEAVFGLCLRTTPSPGTSTQVELTETIPRRCTSRLRSAHTSPTRSPVWSETHAAMATLRRRTPTAPTGSPPSSTERSAASSRAKSPSS